jgi:NAD(P)-dependent dehydrogenase (short-subunit alcohol dehydrogenase family)
MKTALVTGGSRGIGKATVTELASLGFFVNFTYHRNERAAKEVLGLIGQENGAVFSCDLADLDSIRGVFHELDRRGSIPEAVINNAGVAIEHQIGLAEEDWIEAIGKTLEVNLLGPALVAKLAIDRMKRAGSGTIVNVSSRGAYRGEPEMPGYGASKAGLNALTQSLAKAAGPFGISVVAVAPGFVATDMADELLNNREKRQVMAASPLGRMAEASEVAKLIAYLLQPHARHLSGAVVDINGASYFR